jgi:predicted nucleic acid-binding protein
MMRVFIDTNVLVDLVCVRESYVDAAQTIFSMAYEKRIQMYISSLSYINTFYIGRHYKYPSEQLTASLRNISDFVTVLDLTNDAIQKALLSDWADIEDAAQYYSAVEANADCIITRNAKDFTDARIPVLTPTSFLNDFFRS